MSLFEGTCCLQFTFPFLMSYHWPVVTFWLCFLSPVHRSSAVTLPYDTIRMIAKLHFDNRRHSAIECHCSFTFHFVSGRKPWSERYLQGWIPTENWERCAGKVGEGKGASRRCSSLSKEKSRGKVHGDFSLSIHERTPSPRAYFFTVKMWSEYNILMFVLIWSLGHSITTLKNIFRNLIIFLVLQYSLQFVFKEWRGKKFFFRLVSIVPECLLRLVLTNWKERWRPLDTPLNSQLMMLILQVQQSQKKTY